MSNKFFYSLSISFFIGIFTASFVLIPLVFCVSVLSFCLVVLFFVRKNPRGLLFCSILIFFTVGVLRFDLSQNSNHPLDQNIGKKISLTGIICKEPVQNDRGQRFCFAPDDGIDKIIISASRRPLYKYGDRLEVLGVLKLPKNFETYEGGPEFDYISYLGKDDIRYTVSYPKIKIISRGHGSNIISLLIYIKSAFMKSIKKLLPEPHSSLVAGLLLGEKGSLPQSVRDDFKRSGLTHILVLSGSNVTVVAESLLKIFAFLPQTMGRSFGAISIILFALMTGASATTVRATFMALVHLFAEGIGRRYDVVRALILSAIVMLMQNPRILVFDISFQLSFLATIAIIYVSPLIKYHLGFITEKLAMREVFSMTLSVQIFTLPFIIYKMGEISAIALLPNLLVLPAVPYAMLGGFLVGTIGLISQTAALPIALFTRLILGYMLGVVAFFGGLPFATIKTSGGAPLLFIVYAIYILVLIYLWRRRNSLQHSAN